MTSVSLDHVSVAYRVRLADLPKSPSHQQTPTGGSINVTRRWIEVTALDDVSLTLNDGDRLGVLGHNGAGKSTLLRVMAGILPPHAGRVRTEGRISPLLSIQLGLSHFASGYENILIRARYMGIAETEIRSQVNEIAAFSELGDYLFLPLHTYSAGMRLRLAFAIATAFSPDILILDEWLSAGDAKFQAKAARRLHGLIERTRIVVMASHNPALVKKVCNTAVVLDKGRIAYCGSVDDAIELHNSLGMPPRRLFASRRELFEQRRSDLLTIRDALAAYHADHGVYPTTNDNWVSIVQQKSDDWLPDLVPNYLEEVPRDPESTWNFEDPQYVYVSNGAGYKLIARKSGDAHELTPEAVVKPDPKRTSSNGCSAYGVWTADYADK